MKTKAIVWIIGLGLLLTLCSCTGTETHQTPAPTEAVTQTQTEQPQVTEAPTPEPTPVTELALTGEIGIAEIEQAMRDNPALRRIDLTNSKIDIRAEAKALAALDLDELCFRTELCGTEITERTEIFSPLAVPDETDISVLRLLKRLTRIDLSAVLCEPEQIQTVQAAFPTQEILWQYDLCGIVVGPETETLNYNDRPIESLEPFYRTLPLLNRLSSLEMCGCGVGNEDMDALRTAFPNAGIVWTIQTEHWTVRTDADHFATWRIARTDAQGRILEAYNISFNNNADLDWLKYCHDLVALDVGHNILTDCEFVRNMPKLRYLIIADNKISDISPIASLSELRYLEIFANPIKDLSPLSGLKNLVDLNMCGCPIPGLEDLYGLPLERVWMTPYELKNPSGTAEAFHEALPDCELQYITDRDFTGKGWRHHPRYKELRLALGRAKP